MGRARDKDIMEKVSRIEKSIENRKREERRKHKIIKGLEIKKQKRREAADEIMKKIGVKVDIREIRKVGEKMVRGKGEMFLIKFGNEEQKWEII